MHGYRLAVGPGHTVAIDVNQVPGECPPGSSNPDQLEYDESVFHSRARRLLAIHRQIHLYSATGRYLQHWIERVALAVKLVVGDPDGPYFQGPFI